MLLIKIDRELKKYHKENKTELEKKLVSLKKYVEFLNTFPDFNTLNAGILSYEDKDNIAKLYDVVSVPYGTETRIGYVVGFSDERKANVVYKNINMVIANVEKDI